MVGVSSLTLCLTSCYLAPGEDCHFALISGTNCLLGTFKMWPLETTTTSSYSSATVYINYGKFYRSYFKGDQIFSVPLKFYNFLFRFKFLLSVGPPKESIFLTTINAYISVIITHITNYISFMI